MEEITKQSNGMKVYLTTLIQNDWSLLLDFLPRNCNTKYIAITGNNNLRKIILRKGLANYLVENKKIVITDKSELDYYKDDLLGNVVTDTNGMRDEYTIHMLLSFMDGLLSSYIHKLRGRCDYFIFDRSPVDQYSKYDTMDESYFSIIYQIQKPERFEKIDYYIHLDCKSNEEMVKTEGFEKKISYVRELYEDIINGNKSELEFLRTSKHYYVDATNITDEQMLKEVIALLEIN